MKIHQYKLYLFPKEDIHCGFGVQQGNILPSMSCVPGRVVRAGLAGWAVKRGLLKADDALFETLFFSEDETLDFVISYPFCTLKGYEPAPCSLFKLKGSGTDPVSEYFKRDDYEGIVKNDIQNVENFPVDFLCQDFMPSESDKKLNPARGCIYDPDPDNPDREVFLKSAAPLRIDLRNHHEDYGRVGEKSLFAEESLPATNIRRPKKRFYSGLLNFKEDEKINKIFSKLINDEFMIPDFIFPVPSNPFHIFFLGHRRVPVVIYAEDLGCIDTDKDILPFEYRSLNEKSEFTWTAMSDYKPVEGSCYPLNARMIKKELPFGQLKKIKCFCARDFSYGYDVVNNRKLPSEQVLKAGSCGLFEYDPGELSDEGKTRKIWEKSLTGAGKSCKDGFGRFRINWKIHKLQQVDHE